MPSCREELVEKTEGEVSEMMKLRLSMSKTSVKKYEAMERSVCLMEGAWIITVLRGQNAEPIS